MGRGVRQVGRVVGAHRVVGPPVRVRLGEPASGHREGELDRVRRVGRHEVDRGVGHAREERERVADAHLAARRVEAPQSAGVGGAEVGEVGPRPVVLGAEARHDLGVDGGPGRVELDPDRPPGPPRDRRPEERAPDTGERVEDEVPRPREELDEAGHETGRLVRPVPSPRPVAELRGIGRDEDRLREVEPLLPAELVQLVRGVEVGRHARSMAPGAVAGDGPAGDGPACDGPGTAPDGP